jgi:hypothetical protein
VVFELPGNINHLRYSYFWGWEFFNYTTLLMGAIFGIGNFLKVGLDASHEWSDYWLGFGITLLLCGILSPFLLKLFLNPNRQQFIKASVLGIINGLLMYVGFYGFFFINELGWKIVLAFGIIIAAFFILFSRSKLTRVRIYPNRVSIGNMTLYYKDFVKVKWGCGNVEDNLTDQMKTKPLKILSPLVFEESGKDFTIYHYYIIIETKDCVYVAQSLYNRNQLCQNIRNGWLESWRWDGTTVPPEGWIKPEE